MKKRILALLLVMLLVPEGVLAGVSASLNQKMATRSGPGTKYTEELGTLPVTTNIEVISQVDTNGTVWYQVEYRNNGKIYRCYTGKKRVNAYGDIRWENDLYTDDTTCAGAQAYYGPGTQYATRRRSVSKNTAVRVVEVEGEWAQCEYREDGKWARGYLHVDNLTNTVAAAIVPTPAPTALPVPTPAPQRLAATNIIDPVGHLCIDYYGELFNYGNHGEDFALMVGRLPVMSYFDRVPCIRSQTSVYAGPGQHYFRPYLTSGNYAYTGTLDTNLHIYGTENGWLLIRYPSDDTGGYRFGWCTPAAISSENLAKATPVHFAYLPAMTTRVTEATDDPERSLHYAGTSTDAEIQVIALAFLDADREWVYCEYRYHDSYMRWTGPCRGFLPADSLRLLSLEQVAPLAP